MITKFTNKEKINRNKMNDKSSNKIVPFIRKKLKQKTYFFLYDIFKYEI